MLALSEVEGLTRSIGVPQKPQHSNRVLHRGWDMEPRTLLRFFEAAEGGDPRPLADALDDVVERDLTLCSLHEARTDALAGKYLVVQPGAEDAASRDNAATFAEVWNRLDTSMLVRHHQGAKNLYGFGASEIEWAYNEVAKRIDPVGFYHCRARDFFIATTYIRRVPGAQPDELLVRRDDLDFVGERLLPGKWIVTKRTHRVPLARAGLGRGSAMLATLKAMTLTEWVVYIRRFGLPFVTATVRDFTSGTERAQAEAILKALGRDGGAIIAKNGGPELKVLDGAQMSRNAQSDLHARLISTLNLEMAKAWNGATLASESGEGAHSFAQARVHDGIRVSLLEADAVCLETSINEQVIAPWWLLNGLKGAPPRIKFHLTEISDPLTFVQVAEKLHAMGVPLSLQHVLNQTGMRLGSGADLIPRAPAPAAGTNAANAA